MNSDPEIQLVRADPNDLSGGHRGPSADAGTLETPIGHSGSPADVFDHIQNAGHLSDKHNHSSAHRPHWRARSCGDGDASVTSTTLTSRSPKAIDNNASHRRDRRNWLCEGQKYSNKMRHDTETHISNVCGQCNRWKGQPMPAAASRERNCSTAFVCICEIRLSVTPNASPISDSVKPSS